VDVHIKRLRQALRDVGADAQLVTVRGMGYRFNSQT
jgi:DNA-binding response OmpR family regulator